MPETKRGVEVAEIGRFFKALQENQNRNCRVAEIHRLHERTEKRLSETMERKQKLMSGDPEENRKSFLHDVMVG